jgi:hypothetical protein
MSRQPDPTAHASHDLELIAAYAAGDATGARLETATALVAGCEECAALHRDLRAIAAALPDLPAPSRPRDFRLSAEQAATLRPAGWRGLVAALAGPRFRFAAPLGTALATLGLAGVLVGSLAGVPPGTGSATLTELGREAAPATAAPAGAAPTAADQMVNQPEPGAPEAASPLPAVRAGAAGSGSPTTGGAGEANGTPVPNAGLGGATAAPGKAAAPSGAAEAPAATLLPRAPPMVAPDEGVASGIGAVSLTAAASLLALLVGVALVAGRVLARRLVRTR